MHTLIEFAVSEKEVLNEVVKDTFKKLSCMIDNMPAPVSRVEGKVSGVEVAITIMTDDKHVTIAGSWDESNHTFPVQIWNDNVPAGKMNWHPYKGLGGLDLLNFENDFTEIINS